MNKLIKIKEAILAMPLKIDPSDLLVKATAGKLIATKPSGNTHNINKNFYIDYTVEILITDFSANAHLLFSFLLDWVFENIQTYENGDITYEADILDNSSSDLLIKIAGVREVVKEIENSLVVLEDEKLDPFFKKGKN